MRKDSAPATRGIGWIALFALVASCASWWQMLAAYPHTQTHDAKFFLKMIEVMRVSVSRYHELPLWNPFECGGVALWDNPQGVAAAPLMWLALLLGTTRTVEIWYVLHTAVGIVCMWALARIELKMSNAAALVAGAAWGLAGVHNMHFTGGGIVWVSYLYFPLAMMLWRRAEDDLWAAVGTGLIAALTMYEGGTYPLPYLAVLLGVETLFRVWPPRRLGRIVRASVVVLVVAVTVGGPRFLPVFDQLMHHHRDIAPDTDEMKWATLKDVFLARDHGRYVDGQQYVWPEFGGYMGPILLTLAAMGFFLLRSGERWLIPLFLFCFALMGGHFAKYAPWSVLNEHVYPFKQMRVPSRFLVTVTIFISLFAGIAVERIPRLFRRFRPSRGDALVMAALSIGMIGVGDEMSVGENRLMDAVAWSEAGFAGPPLNLDATPRAWLYYNTPARKSDKELYEPDGHGGVTSPFLNAPALNAPDLGCWEEWAFERDAPLWLGDVPQARQFTANVKINRVDRTPNTFSIDLEASGAGRILVNSPYDRGWRTDRGETLEQGKMLAIDVPSGTYTLHVRYWPHGLTLGFALAGASSVLLVALFVRTRRRRRGMAHAR